MTVKYDMYAAKRLNEVVIAGTHDAGIYKGGRAAKTQALKIGEQAEAGVRIFDLRVTAVATGYNRVSGGVKLKTYHGGMLAAAGGNRRIVNSAIGKRDVTVQTPGLGTVMGQGLQSMLQDARQFVTSNPTEFLIFKFDKCTNWDVIADVCEDELGPTMYTGGAALNIAPLTSLAGRVIVLFSAKGRAEANENGVRPGIYAFTNLAKSGGDYDPAFCGLQYYGKGGTKVVNGNEFASQKIRENIKKQRKLLDAAIELASNDMGNARVVRMVYWTTTGSVHSIEERDKVMWKGSNVSKFYGLWASGLRDYYDAGGNLPVAPNPTAAAIQLKMRIPNIVMMDFASHEKCRIVRDLNTIDPATLATLADLRNALGVRADAARALLRR